MTTAQAMEIGSRLINLLNQQRLLYRQLQELAQKQSSLVNGSDPEMLLRVLAGRQRLIDRLAAVDKDLEPIRRDWQEIARLLPENQRQEAQSLVESVQEILGEIIARDENDSQALSRQREKVAGEIRTAVTGKRVNNLYARSGPIGPEKLDADLRG